MAKWKKTFGYKGQWKKNNKGKRYRRYQYSHTKGRKLRRTEVVYFPKRGKEKY